MTWVLAEIKFELRVNIISNNDKNDVREIAIVISYKNYIILTQKNIIFKLPPIRFGSIKHN